MVRFGFSFAALASLLSLGLATCPKNKILPNKVAERKGIRNGPGFCNPQGEGSWTFTMDVAAVDVPTFDGDNPNAGYVSRGQFIIYDHTCKVRGVYPVPGCQWPWTIEDYFLPYVLTIEKAYTGLGDLYYDFKYAAGEYRLGSNQCVCHDVSHGLTGESACPCAFPINGE